MKTLNLLVTLLFTFLVTFLAAIGSSAAWAESEVSEPVTHADVEPPFLSSVTNNGAYVAPALKFARITGTGGVLAGAKGGWVINHGFVLGAGVFGIVNNIPTLGIATSSNRLDYVYGGLMLEYIIAPEKRVHAALSTLIGGGGIGARSTNYQGTRSATTFVVEPEIDGLVNVSESIRAGLGVSFRMNRATTVAGLNNSDLSGANASLFMQFGAF